MDILGGGLCVLSVGLALVRATTMVSAHGSAKCPKQNRRMDGCERRMQGRDGGKPGMSMGSGERAQIGKNIILGPKWPGENFTRKSRKPLFRLRVATELR